MKPGKATKRVPQNKVASSSYAGSLDAIKRGIPSLHNYTIMLLMSAAPAAPAAPAAAFCHSLHISSAVRRGYKYVAMFYTLLMMLKMMMADDNEYGDDNDDDGDII